MKRLFLLLSALALVTAAQAAPLPLSRGISVQDWLNWSPLAADGAYRWPPYRTETEWLTAARPLSDWPQIDQFGRIRAMGFDFVRLSVDPGPLLASEGRRREEALAVLAKSVARVTSSGLKVVFDLHAAHQVPAYSIDMIEGGVDSEGVTRYRDMVGHVARMLTAFSPDKVALEPFNEPQHYPCGEGGTGDWQRIMAATVADIRAISTDLTIVVTGACGGGTDGLSDLDPSFDDPNLYYSFHVYEPHGFTHQLSEDGRPFNSGLPWPADAGTPADVVARLKAHMAAAGLGEAEQAANIIAASPAIDDYFTENWGVPQLQARIGAALAWAERHGIPARRLFIGEFGCFSLSDDGRSGAYDADRLRYLAAVRLEAERHGIPWAVWEYTNPHGISLIAPWGPAVPDLGMLKALGLL